MRIIVEVPVYMRVEVDAPDRETAIDLAQRCANDDDCGLAVIDWEVVPLDETEDDREPDVYVCRGGKLNQLGPGDLILPLDEDC